MEVLNYKQEVGKSLFQDGHQAECSCGWCGTGFKNENPSTIVGFAFSYMQACNEFTRHVVGSTFLKFGHHKFGDTEHILKIVVLENKLDRK